MDSLAENNENHELELLGTWEPTCSRCALSSCEGKSSQNLVSYGNKTVRIRDEIDSSWFTVSKYVCGT